MKQLNPKKSPVLRLNRPACEVAALLALLAGTALPAQAQEYFNPVLLELGRPDQKGVDLSVFEQPGGQKPGTYRVDVYLNQQKIETREVPFVMAKDVNGRDQLQPCLSVETLKNWGVLTQVYPVVVVAGSDCANIQGIPQASATFEFRRQQLMLSFPQSAVRSAVRGWVDPASWDHGIPAFLLNYSASGSNRYGIAGQDNGTESQYVNLRPGINIGAWRLRNYTTWNHASAGSDSETTRKLETVYTYAQRDVQSLSGQLRLGDSSSPSDVFDSIPFRGVQLASDDDMSPASLRGYAPVVRGIARSNAEVTIRQNGYVIYRSAVSPGAFEITDMYPTGGAGDLHVTIEESDGSEQQLVIPFASLPVLQREGRLKYSLTGGTYRAYDGSVDKAPLVQGTVIYGLPWRLTAYGGGQFADHYQSVAAGLGQNLGDFGAVSVDLTQAWSTPQDEERTAGQSWRLRYSKNFVGTGTNLALAGYRYASSGFRGMQEVLESYGESGYSSYNERRRNRAEMTLAQQLGENAGSLSLNAVREDYYNSGKTLESWGAGYYNAWNSINYSINYSYNRNAFSSDDSETRYNEDQLVSLNVSIPFSIFGKSDSSSYANYYMNSSKAGSTTQTASLSGTALAQNNLSWSVQQGYGNRGQGNSGGGTLNWRNSAGELNGGFSYDAFGQRVNYGVQGGIVAHANGVTFGQSLGETIALVAAQDAVGVEVQGAVGVKTDFRGYAIVPNASPYRRNNFTLDPRSFSENTEVAITTRTVVPTRGAVVRADYQTNVGYRVLMDLQRADGEVVPFGAVATDAASKNADGFIVADNGQVYLTGLKPRGSLLVKWGQGGNQQCRVNYQLPDEPKGITQINGACR